MSNYVANYVFCNDELYNDFLIVDFDHRLFQEGMYEPVGCKLDDGRRLVLFETRGMEYKSESIQKIVRRYNDVVWNCVEENRIEEGQFYWDGEKVALTMRELQEPVDDCFFMIEYGDPEFRTFQLIIGFPDRIVQENFVNNTRRVYKLSDPASQQIRSFMTDVKDFILEDSDNGALATDERDSLWEEYYFWEKNFTDRAEIIRLDRNAFPEELFIKGYKMIQKVKSYLEIFFANNDIDINLSYRTVGDFAMMDTGNNIEKDGAI